MSIRQIALCSLLIANCSFIFAQEGETRFIQRITWNEDEYARSYEVIIEKEEEPAAEAGGRGSPPVGTYSELRRESTPESFIETPLLPGNYRCRVIPHNFLNQPGEASEWRYIEVRAALNPELDDILPKFILSRTATESGVALYEMRVTGKNLIPGAEIFLRDGGGTRMVPFRIQNGGNGANVRLFFEKNLLTEGDYELIVINPGGLRTSKSGIPFPSPESAQPGENQKKLDIFLSAAWMPSFTISDKEDSFFGRNLSLVGVVGRFGVTSAKPSYFRPGAELAVSYNFFDTNSGEQDPAHHGAIHLWGVAINFSAMKRLHGDRMALTFRLGAGYSVLFHANMGVSFLYFVLDHWYLETGLNYAYWFSNPPSSCFRPWLGIGFCK
jgi:hypothetical protein